MSVLCTHWLVDGLPSFTIVFDTDSPQFPPHFLTVTFRSFLLYWRGGTGQVRRHVRNSREHVGKRQKPPAMLTIGHWTGKRPWTANRCAHARNSPGAISHRTKGEDLFPGRTMARKTACRNAKGERRQPHLRQLQCVPSCTVGVGLLTRAFGLLAGAFGLLTVALGLLAGRGGIHAWN